MKTREPINLSDSTMDMVIKMAEGNPGAIADCDCFLCRRARQDDAEIAETFNAFQNRYAKQYGTLDGVDEARAKSAACTDTER